MTDFSGDCLVAGSIHDRLDIRLTSLQTKFAFEKSIEKKKTFPQAVNLQLSRLCLKQGIVLDGLSYFWK